MIAEVGRAVLTMALVAGGAHLAQPVPAPVPAPEAVSAHPASQGAKPRTPTIGEVGRQLRRAERAVRDFERVGRRMARWFTCVKHLPVDQVGDLHHRWGFEYDERDGTGLDLRPALVRHRGPGRPDVLLLRFSRSAGCVSRAPDPNGTGADARSFLRSVEPTGASAKPARGDRGTRMKRLEKRMRQLLRRIDRVDTAFSRYDEWESCLSWLPVTELGHEDQNLGFRFDQPGGPAEPQQHVAAVDIDASEWDDPDYNLLAFLGRDRPFSNVECGHDPGEGVDRVVAPAARPGQRRHRGSVPERVRELSRDLRSAQEDIEDLVEPVAEFVQFDECMYTVGMRSRGGPDAGYRFVRPDGTLEHRDALSFDLTGLRLPQMDIMAFSGEEPPQIECNEDAAGEFTDE